MFFDPLEQFNIIGLFKHKFCPYYSFILDNVSMVGFLNISLVFILFYVLNGIKLDSGVTIKYSIYAAIYEFKKILHSNMAFKKQIFFCFFITVFSFILFSNSFGMVPYSSTVTSFFAISFFFCSNCFFKFDFSGS